VERELFECPVCLEEKPLDSKFLYQKCDHEQCRECAAEFFQRQIELKIEIKCVLCQAPGIALRRVVIAVVVVVVVFFFLLLLLVAVVAVVAVVDVVVVLLLLSSSCCRRRRLCWCCCCCCCFLLSMTLPFSLAVTVLDLELVLAPDEVKKYRKMIGDPDAEKETDRMDVIPVARESMSLFCFCFVLFVCLFGFFLFC
jgi:hypothetical protein